MPARSDAATLEAQVRDALAHLYDPVHLQTHPLAAPLGGARTLRKSIEEAVDALKPPRDGRPRPGAVRRYELLRLRYLEAEAVDEVQRKLLIGRSEYYREHERAIAAVASLLRERGRPSDAPTASTPVHAESPAPTVPPPPTTDPQLAEPLTSFIGREAELTEIERLLGTTRLVTLTGPGGSGKTRLALAAARAANEQFRDGVVFVSLAPLVDPALVLPTVAQALGVRAAAGQHVAEALANYLRARAALLVLDNFEQVLPAADGVAALLRACRQLTVLVTSRAPLRVYGEHELAVPPLPVPPASESSDLGGYEAVRLFAERARAARDGFVVTPENAAVVAEVCRRVDGLPLAIELAAARIRLFDPAGLLARMGTALPVLIGGARDLPSRQRTLRGAIGWSHDLLSDADRMLFRRLAVLADGFTLEAAEVVCGRDGDLDVVGGVESLLAQSLLQRDDAGGVPRFRMLELVREYAVERLAEAGELSRMRRTHATYFVEWIAALVHRSEDAVWLDAQAREYGNLRAALGWTVEADEAELSLTLTDLMTWFWNVRGDRAEGRDWLTRVLALPSAQARTAARARELRHLAVMCWMAGDPAGRERGYKESLAIAREVGDDAGVVESLCQLSPLALDRGDVVAARALAEEAVALGRRVGKDVLAARALNHLGLVATQVGEFPEARSRFEEALALQRTVKDVWGMGFVLGNLGRLASIEGDHVEAERLHLAQRDVFDRGGDRAGQLDAEVMRAQAAVRRGDGEAARALLLGALPQLRRIANPPILIQAMETLACVVAGSEPERALRWLGAADAARDALVMARRSWSVETIDAALAPALATMPPEAFRAARQAGRTMTIEDAVTEALERS